MEAKQYPDRSYERRRILNRLANKIFQSPKLHRPHCDSLPPAISEDLYREALNITVMEICKKIDKYDSSRDVLGWVNFLLKNRFIDLLRKWKNMPSLDEIDPIGSEPDPSASADLKQWIEADPDGFFTRKHIKKNPKATFQFIVLARIWEDRKWEDISAELNISNSTLCEFYKQQLRELKPYFKDFLAN
ncbi:MAG: sigma-70 family RNA polymerase sigma factor [Cyanobacteria bacterium J055]|nr:MAG: sigma-70 family RNA polymerase sigma factor [Cyanobacteria bacterium J055]